MGLLDKLREVADSAINAINKAIDDTNSVKNPLADETVKKYFEIIYGMQSSLGIWENETIKGNTRAKRYIEHYIGEMCDEEKLEQTLELYNFSWSDERPKNEVEVEIREFRRGLKGKELYKCEPEKAYRMCYQELISAINTDYNKILDVIKDNVNCMHFVEGFKKYILEKYEKEYGEQLDCCMYIVVTDSFYEGNPVTKELLFKFYMDILNNRINNPSEDSKVCPVDIVISIALHALHFEKYGQQKEGYTSVTDEECREQIINKQTYVRIIDDHPFEKDAYVQMFINILKSAYGFVTSYSSFVQPRRGLFSSPTALSWSSYNKVHFVDALANYVWKRVAEEYVNRTNDKGENISESQDPTDIADMLFDYFKNLD